MSAKSHCITRNFFFSIIQNINVDYISIHLSAVPCRNKRLELFGTKFFALFLEIPARVNILWNNFLLFQKHTVTFVHSEDKENPLTRENKIENFRRTFFKIVFSTIAGDNCGKNISNVEVFNSVVIKIILVIILARCTRGINCIVLSI